MKKKKMVAALTAAVLICTSGCSLGGTGEKNKNRSKNTFVNTHAYVEAGSERHTETGLDSRNESFTALEIPDTAEYIADFLCADEKRVFSQLYKGRYRCVYLHAYFGVSLYRLYRFAVYYLH